MNVRHRRIDCSFDAVFEIGNADTTGTFVAARLREEYQCRPAPERGSGHATVNQFHQDSQLTNRDLSAGVRRPAASK